MSTRRDRRMTDLIVVNSTDAILPRDAIAFGSVQVTSVTSKSGGVVSKVSSLSKLRSVTRGPKADNGAVRRPRSTWLVEVSTNGDDGSDANGSDARDASNAPVDSLRVAAAEQATDQFVVALSARGRVVEVGADDMVAEVVDDDGVFMANFPLKHVSAVGDLDLVVPGASFELSVAPAGSVEPYRIHFDRLPTPTAKDLERAAWKAEQVGLRFVLENKQHA